MHQPNMGPPRGGCNEGIPYILEETPHIPGPLLPGIPPKWGPNLEAKSHSNIGAPDGHSLDLAHITCSRGPQYGVPRSCFGTPILGP